ITQQKNSSSNTFLHSLTVALNLTIQALILIIPVGLFNAHLLGGSHVLIDNLFNLNWNVKAFGSWDFFYYRSYS
ncbi:hypothetical protein L2832_10525, partial [Lactobacillus crispatus]|nr:hypothetical protein [Lactobacillus crispatus]MCZ3525557.1 hypothetical protein [Lactobacillus crispatus]MCZ3529477.1 hypothetical protein [Lactobacillus crispatus]MCZ3536940.1 hypothetical protein [Lactobacillus crispatus]